MVRSGFGKSTRVKTVWEKLQEAELRRCRAVHPGRELRLYLLPSRVIKGGQMSVAQPSVHVREGRVTWGGGSAGGCPASWP